MDGFRQWYQVDIFGERVHPGTTIGKKMTRFEAFQLMYPPEQLELELALTNENLRKKHWRETTCGELMKFRGIMLLMTRVWCRNRKELWNKRPSYKYIPANEFGMTGMTYHRWI